MSGLDVWVDRKEENVTTCSAAYDTQIMLRRADTRYIKYSIIQTLAKQQNSRPFLLASKPPNEISIMRLRPRIIK
jgi:hypothetical protein